MNKKKKIQGDKEYTFEELYEFLKKLKDGKTNAKISEAAFNELIEALGDK